MKIFWILLISLTLSSCAMIRKSDQSKPVAEKKDETVVDKLGNCAKRKAALEACEKMSWPASTACKISAKTKYSCEVTK